LTDATYNQRAFIRTNVVGACCLLEPVLRSLPAPIDGRVESCIATHGPSAATRN